MVKSKAVVLRQLKGAGWGSRFFGKAKSLFKKHAKKHIATAKKWGKKALTEGKKQAAAAARAALEEAKKEAKQALQDTAEEAIGALHQHVKSHVCSAVGSGFFRDHKRQLKKMLHKEFDGVHKKALAHARTGKKGGALNDHVDKAHARVTASVDRLKNKAKSRIREVAGCDEEEGSGMRIGGGFKKKKRKSKY